MLTGFRLYAIMRERKKGETRIYMNCLHVSLQTFEIFADQSKVCNNLDPMVAMVIYTVIDSNKCDISE